MPGWGTLIGAGVGAGLGALQSSKSGKGSEQEFDRYSEMTPFYQPIANNQMAFNNAMSKMLMLGLPGSVKLANGKLISYAPPEGWKGLLNGPQEALTPEQLAWMDQYSQQASDLMNQGVRLAKGSPYGELPGYMQDIVGDSDFFMQTANPYFNQAQEALQAQAAMSPELALRQLEQQGRLGLGGGPRGRNLALASEAMLQTNYDAQKALADLNMQRAQANMAGQSSRASYSQAAANQAAAAYTRALQGIGAGQGIMQQGWQGYFAPREQKLADWDRWMQQLGQQRQGQLATAQTALTPKTTHEWGTMSSQQG